MYIAIVCLPVCDVMNFEINLIFLIELSLCAKNPKVKTKIKYLENENKKAFFIILKGLSVAKNCFRPESASLK